jgi:ribokinase
MSALSPIVVIGSINMDLVARTPRIPLAGQTLTGTEFATTPGGKGANQTVAAARLGAHVQMIGAVGDDVFGEALLGNLANAAVDTRAVSRIPGPSGVAQIQVADNGQNSIVVVPGTNGAVTPALIRHHTALIQAAGIVLLQLEIPLETVLAACELCAAANVPVILDPAPAAPLPDAIWPQLAWFTPNETELGLYTGSGLPPETAAKQLLARGVQGVALKRGAEGVYIAASGEEPAWIRAFPVEAIDTVGAGDCFNGAFAVSLLEGSSPADAARFASAAAAISVTRRGAQAAMPTREEVDAFLATHN